MIRMFSIVCITLDIVLLPPTRFWRYHGVKAGYNVWNQICVNIIKQVTIKKLRTQTILKFKKQMGKHLKTKFPGWYYCFSQSKMFCVTELCGCFYCLQSWIVFMEFWVEHLERAGLFQGCVSIGYYIFVSCLFCVLIKNDSKVSYCIIGGKSISTNLTIGRYV